MGRLGRYRKIYAIDGNCNNKFICGTVKKKLGRCVASVFFYDKIIFMRDKYSLLSTITAGILTVLLSLVCYTEQIAWENIAHLACAALYLIISIIFREKVVFPGLVVISIILSYTLPMSNILPWFFGAIAILIRPRYKLHIFAMYIINTFLESILIDKNILPRHVPGFHGVLHLSIHLVLVLFFFVSVEHFLKNRYVKKELQLNEDEKKILDELLQEKMLKNCRSFSKNTMTQKLKEARERNGIDSNAELLAQYKMVNNPN